MFGIIRPVIGNSGRGGNRVEYSFNQDLLKHLREWEYRVITVCLDKKNHIESYGSWRHDPYHYCMAVLLERFNFWLSRSMAQGDVMTESRGGKEDNRLKEAFRELWREGTQFVRPDSRSRSLTCFSGNMTRAEAGSSGRIFYRQKRIPYGPPDGQTIHLR